MKTILITGINGYVARHLAHVAMRKVEFIHGSVRDDRGSHELIWKLYPVDLFETGDLANFVDWRVALKEVDTVFHLAGTVHSTHEREVYQRVIVRGTQNLVEQAIHQGVKHFVFLSSASVYGRDNFSEKLRETDPVFPNTPYGEAKLSAEYELIRLCQPSKMTYTIVRPPLVTGIDAPGNTARLKSLIRKFSILPFGGANAKRSMVNVHTLVEFLLTCGEHPKARNQIFNIADPEDLSTREFCQLLAKELDKYLVLLPIPSFIMRFVLSTFGKQTLYDKLFGSLLLNITHSKARLD